MAHKSVFTITSLNIPYSNWSVQWTADHMYAIKLKNRFIYIEKMTKNVAYLQRVYTIGMTL